MEKGTEANISLDCDQQKVQTKTLKQVWSIRRKHSIDHQKNLIYGHTVSFVGAGRCLVVYIINTKIM